MAKYTFVDGYVIVYNSRDQTFEIHGLIHLDTFGIKSLLFKSNDEIQIYKKLEVMNVRVIPERFLAANRLVDYFSSILS